MTRRLVPRFQPTRQARQLLAEPLGSDANPTHPQQKKPPRRTRGLEKFGGLTKPIQSDGSCRTIRRVVPASLTSNRRLNPPAHFSERMIARYPMAAIAIDRVQTAMWMTWPYGPQAGSAAVTLNQRTCNQVPAVHQHEENQLEGQRYDHRRQHHHAHGHQHGSDHQVDYDKRHEQ